MAKKFPDFQNFGEFLYYAYANLQMLHYALKDGKPRYDRMCYMIRAKAFKAYKEGCWNINDLFEFNYKPTDMKNKLDSLRSILLVIALLLTLSARAQLGRYNADIRALPQDFTDTISVEWERDQVYVPVTAGGRTYHFLLDTGAGQAVVFGGSPLADAPRVSSLLSRDAAGNIDTVSVVQLPPLKLGRTTLYNCQATVQQRGVGARSIDGILGFDLVNSGLSLKLDMQSKQLIISDRECCFDKEQAEACMKYTLSYHVPYVDIIPFGRKRERVLFDTGSRNFFSMNINHFNDAEEQRHRFDRPYRVEGRAMGRHAIGHGGTEPMGEVVFLRLDSLGMGDCSFKDVHAITTQGGSHLGARLLRYGTVAFCPRHSRLFFHPYEGLTTSVNNRQIDIAFIADAMGRPQVGLVWPQGTPYYQGFRQGDVIEQIDGRPVRSLVQFVTWPFERGREYVFTVRSADGRRHEIKWIRVPQ